MDKNANQTFVDVLEAPETDGSTYPSGASNSTFMSHSIIATALPGFTSITRNSRSCSLYCRYNYFFFYWRNGMHQKRTCADTRSTSPILSPIPTIVIAVQVPLVFLKNGHTINCLETRERIVHTFNNEEHYTLEEK